MLIIFQSKVIGVLRFLKVETEPLEMLIGQALYCRIFSLSFLIQFILNHVSLFQNIV